MIKHVLCLGLIALVLGAIEAAVADGNYTPGPNTSADPVLRLYSPKLLADGPNPIPWPKAGITEKVELLADGPNPIPWPKAATEEPVLVADGPNPIPWPKLS